MTYLDGTTVKFLNGSYVRIEKDKIGRSSWLIWKLRDIDRQLVGSGVYIWKVLYTPIAEDGEDPPPAFTEIYKQAIIRTNQTNICNNGPTLETPPFNP